MKDILNALWNGQKNHPFVIRRIEKDDQEKPRHPVDFSCSVINTKKERYEDRFDIIIFVKIKNGFYIIPFQKIQSWFADTNMTVRPDLEKIWRLWFRMSHEFRATSLAWANMEEYFYDTERMKSWLHEHHPEWESLLSQSDAVRGDLTVEQYVEALKKVNLYDYAKRLLAELYFDEPKKAKELAKVIGRNHHGSVNMLLGRWVGVPLRKALGYDYLASGKEAAVESFIDFQKYRGTFYFSLLPNFRTALETVFADELNHWKTLKIDAESLENASTPTVAAYSVDDIVVEGCFIEKKRLGMMLAALERKKNIILQGPPGTGKTWLAKRLAYAAMRRKDRTKITAVQFHPNMSYEDFVCGYRPANGGDLDLVDGPFLEMIETARKNIDEPHFFIIEEINRGNPAQIFGEMLTLLEADKRFDPNRSASADNELKLAYDRPNGKTVQIPSNLHVIGTMNIADRSLAMVDLALRRRFAFFTLEPCFDETWEKFVAEKGGIEVDRLQKIRTAMSNLNEKIAKTKELGSQFRIGHSYFVPSMRIDDSRQWLNQIVDEEIAPILDEYWFDNSATYEKAIEELKKTLELTGNDQ